MPSSLEDHSGIELEEAAMGHVVIGMDPHKHSATIEVMAGMKASLAAAGMAPTPTGTG